MEATLTVRAAGILYTLLKAIDKYDNIMDITIRRDEMVLSCATLSKSAWVGLTLKRSFFETYSCRLPEGQDECIGAILVKLVLRPLKIAGAPSSQVLAVKLSLIYPGRPITGSDGEYDSDDSENHPSIDWRLLVSLECTHDVRKGWYFTILVPDNHVMYNPPRADKYETITIAAENLNSLERHLKTHFTKPSGQIAFWAFDDELIICTSADGDLSTTCYMHPDDFIAYKVETAETALSFHIQEFAATIHSASTLRERVTLQFTEPGAPLFITIAPSPVAQGEGTPGSWHLFGAISTSTVNSDRPKRPSLGIHTTIPVDADDPIEDIVDEENTDVLMDVDTPDGPPAPTAVPAATTGFVPIALESLLDADEDQHIKLLVPSTPDPSSTTASGGPRAGVSAVKHTAQFK